MNLFSVVSSRRRCSQVKCTFWQCWARGTLAQHCQKVYLSQERRLRLGHFMLVLSSRWLGTPKLDTIHIQPIEYQVGAIRWMSDRCGQKSILQSLYEVRRCSQCTTGRKPISPSQNGKICVWKSISIKTIYAYSGALEMGQCRPGVG